MTLHTLLAKQLDRAAISVAALPENLRKLIERVSQVYDDADVSRYRLERSITLSAEEMTELAGKLAAERDRLRVIFDSAAVGMLQANMDGVIIECNDTSAALLGMRREDLIGRSWREFIHPEDRTEEWATRSPLVLDQPLSIERRYVHRGGYDVWAAVTVSTVRDPVSGVPISNIAVQRDITAQRHLEMSLRHAQKLEAVGKLAAGVAHEINTPLQFVGDNVEFMRNAFGELLALYDGVRELVSNERAPDLARLEAGADIAFIREEGPRAVVSARDGVTHMSKIVRAMKVLAHHEHDDAPRLVDVNALLETAMILARSETKYVAEVTAELGEIPSIMGFGDDLTQVFVNLIVNAAHAVGDVVKGTGTHGTIRVRTELTRRAVLITIRDSGCGMPEAVRPRVFEPFFTTKDVGRGTGQGLALAHAIVVDKHAGEITFETQVGQGTTFYVALPFVRPGKQAA